MRLLEELWYGNIEPAEYNTNACSEYKEALRLIAKNEEKLRATLTDEQKEIFEKFDDCWSEYTSYAEEAIFTYAFKLGMQIAIETLTE